MCELIMWEMFLAQWYESIDELAQWAVYPQESARNCSMKSV